MDDEWLRLGIRKGPRPVRRCNVQTDGSGRSKLLEDPAYREAFKRDLHEAYRQDAGGQIVDSALTMTSRDWGFSLKEIKVPVFLWHGEDDTLVSPNMARHLAADIPNCTASYVKGAGHLLTAIPEVVEEVKRILIARAV